MNTEEALRVVEGVLNEYRAVERMSEVLGNVMQAEVAEAELKQRADGLHKAIIELEAGVVEAKSKAYSERKAASAASAAAMTKMKNVEDAKWRDIKEAEFRLEGLRNMAGEMEKANAARLEEMNTQAGAIQNEAAAAADRLAKIEAKIAELKGM